MPAGHCLPVCRVCVLGGVPGVLVGVLEEMTKSVAVFESYIPKFFINASNTYQDIVISTNKDRLNKNVCRPRVLKKFLGDMRHNFSLEIDFYNFCKSRLHKQYLLM